jgi:hypothetical protein
VCVVLGNICGIVLCVRSRVEHVYHVSSMSIMCLLCVEHDEALMLDSMSAVVTVC